MQKAQVNDYLLIKQKLDNDKEVTSVILVKKVDGDTITAVIPEYNHLFDTTAKYELSDYSTKIIANLGSEPAITQINGHRVISAVGFKRHTHLGKIHFFFKPGKKLIKDLFPILDALYLQVHNKGLDIIFSELSFEIYNDKNLTGRKAVQYYYDKEYSIRTIRIYAEEELLSQDVDNYVSALISAFTMSIPGFILNHSAVAGKWAAAFCALSHVESIDKNSIDTLVQDFLDNNASGQTLSQYIKTLDNDREENPVSERDIFKLHAKTAAKLYKLTVKDLDNMSADALQADTLKTIITANTFESWGLLMSCYSYLEPYSKNLKTFIAGAFYLYLTDSTLPQPIRDRCKSTFTTIKLDE